MVEFKVSYHAIDGDYLNWGLFAILRDLGRRSPNPSWYNGVDTLPGCEPPPKAMIANMCPECRRPIDLQTRKCIKCGVEYEVVGDKVVPVNG